VLSMGSSCREEGMGLEAVKLSSNTSGRLRDVVEIREVEGPVQQEARVSGLESPA